MLRQRTEKTEIEVFLEPLFLPFGLVLLRLISGTLNRFAFLGKPLRSVWFWLWNESLSNKPAAVLGRSQRVYSLRALFVPYLPVVALIFIVLGGTYFFSQPTMEIIDGLLPVMNVYIPRSDRFETDDPHGAKTNAPQWKGQFGQGFIGFVRLMPVSDQPEPDTKPPSEVYSLGQGSKYDSTLPTSYSPNEGDGFGIHPVFSQTELMERLEPDLLTITPPASPLPPPINWDRLAKIKYQEIDLSRAPVVSPDTAVVTRFAKSQGLRELFALVKLCIDANNSYYDIETKIEVPPNIGVGAAVKQALLRGSCKSAQQLDSSGNYVNVHAVRYFSYTITDEGIRGCYITGDTSQLKVVLLPRN